MLVLGSSSPRRREILRSMGLEFRVVEPRVREVIYPDPVRTVMENALSKALSVQSLHPDLPILASDTVVFLDEILPKPSSPEEAFVMLRKLSGRKHTVFTATVLLHGNRRYSYLDFARVLFYPMTEQEIEWYVGTGEPMDKAGAYAVQGLGARFIRRVEGDFFTVVGLSPAIVYRLLMEADLVGLLYR